MPFPIKTRVIWLPEYVYIYTYVYIYIHMYIYIYVFFQLFRNEDPCDLVLLIVGKDFLLNMGLILRLRGDWRRSRTWEKKVC